MRDELNAPGRFMTTIFSRNAPALSVWFVCSILFLEQTTSLRSMFLFPSRRVQQLLPSPFAVFTTFLKTHRRPSPLLPTRALSTATSIPDPSFLIRRTTAMSSSSTDVVDVANITESDVTPTSSPSNTIFSKQPFPEHLLSYDFYNGVTLRLDKIQQGDINGSFQQDLEDALRIWQMEQRKGIWIHVPKHLAHVVPICVDLGFSFHSVPDSNVLMLARWLPVGSPSRLPFGPTHQVGVGIFVTAPNNPSHMLVVRERTGPAAARQLWKMPTGLLDPGEEIGPAAVRELKEETGLAGIFEGIICFRHATNVASGRSISDLFFVCRVKLYNDENFGNDDLKVLLASRTLLQKEEIADIRWMSVAEYASQETWQESPVYRELNQVLLDRDVSSRPEPVDNALLRGYSLPIGFAPGSNTLYKSLMAKPSSKL